MRLTPATGEVEAALRGILPGEVEVRACTIGAVELDAHADEVAYVQRALPPRRLEFLTGRTLARALLRKLGVGEAALLRGEGRAPRWPPGVAGSIAHKGSLCIVAIAPDRLVRSIGVDVEPDAPLEPRLWPRICTPAERAWLGARPEPQRGLWARFFFSAKEAFYKAQHPLTATFLEFHAVELVPASEALETGVFRIAVPGSVQDALGASELSGRYTRACGYLLTAVAVV